MPSEIVTVTEEPPRGSETSLLKSGAHTVTTNVGQVFGVLATTALVARALGPEQKGTYDLYIATSALLSTIFGFSLSSGVTFVIASRGANRRRLITSLIVFAFIQGLLAWGLVVSLERFRFGHSLVPLKIGPSVGIAIGLTTVVAALSGTFRAVLAGQRRFITANHGDLIKQALSVTFGLIAFVSALLLGFNPVKAFIVANICAVGATSAVFLRSINAWPSDDIVSSGFREAALFSIPCYASTVVQFLNYRLDVFFVNSLSGARELGLYQLAVLLCQGINLVPGAAQSVLFPTISAYSGVRDTTTMVAQANRLLTSFGVVCAALLGIAGYFGIPLVFGESFRASVPALLFLIPGCVAFVTCNVIAGYFAGIGKPRLNLYASLAGIGVTVPLDILLIPKWGISGAAIASTISYCTTSLVTAVVFSRLTSISLPAMIVLNGEDMSLIRNYTRRSWEKLSHLLLP